MMSYSAQLSCAMRCRTWMRMSPTKKLMYEQQPSSFDSVGCAKIDKPSQRTCLPRGSVRQHISLSAQSVLSFSVLVVCSLSQFCPYLSCANVPDRDHVDSTLSAWLKKQIVPHSPRNMRKGWPRMWSGVRIVNAWFARRVDWTHSRCCDISC